MASLRELSDAGQAVWLDYIHRGMLRDGELQSLVDDGLRGLTSNPTIFQQAIETSEDYDEQIAALVSDNPDIEALQLFEHLAVTDIRAAADVLRPVYDSNDGRRGFVSLEVSPHLAHDTEGTIAEAKRLWEWVDRPNLMVKVPAAPAGIPAVEELTAAGLNINVTLMFSLEAYVEVAHAYVRGATRARHPERLASVASFFVSRVDNKVDAELEKIGSDEALALRGKIAVANAKLAYRHYQDIFEGPAFAEVGRRGGHPQRVLWASTSTKNPEYSDVLYIESLVGPNTVNTMPPTTIEAFRDHGRVDPNAVTADVDEAARQFAELERLGISMKRVTDELLDEGVRKFADSFDDLLSTLGHKIDALS